VSRTPTTPLTHPLNRVPRLLNFFSFQAGLNGTHLKQICFFYILKNGHDIIFIPWPPLPCRGSPVRFGDPWKGGAGQSPVSPRILAMPSLYCSLAIPPQAHMPPARRQPPWGKIIGTIGKKSGFP